MRNLRFALFSAALLAVGCGDSSNPASPSNNSDGSMVTVIIRNNVFSPNPVTVRVGQQVNWRNEDNTDHNAIADGRFDSGTIPPMSAHSVPATMTTAGTISYRCTIHPGMTGTIVVQ
jgi:plastocyanin